jgi:hypothetical protein
VIAKLHTRGILDDIGFAERSNEVDKSLMALKDERHALISDDSNEEIIDKLKRLCSLMEKQRCAPAVFDEDIFSKVVVSIIPHSPNEFDFKLLGGLILSEYIPEINVTSKGDNNDIHTLRISDEKWNH